MEAYPSMIDCRHCGALSKRRHRAFPSAVQRIHPIAAESKHPPAALLLAAGEPKLACKSSSPPNPAAMLGACRAAARQAACRAFSTFAEVQRAVWAGPLLPPAALEAACRPTAAGGERLGWLHCRRRSSPPLLPAAVRSTKAQLVTLLCLPPLCPQACPGRRQQQQQQPGSSRSASARQRRCWSQRPAARCGPRLQAACCSSWSRCGQTLCAASGSGAYGWMGGWVHVWGHVSSACAFGAAAAGLLSRPAPGHPRPMQRDEQAQASQAAEAAAHEQPQVRSLSGLHCYRHSTGPCKL